MTSAPTPDIAPITVPAISPGTFVRLRREALALTFADVAARITTVPDVSVWRRVQWLKAIEQDDAPISVQTAVALHDAIGLDLRMLSYWMAVAEGAPHVFIVEHQTGVPGDVA